MPDASSGRTGGARRPRWFSAPLLFALTALFALNIYIYARSAAGPYIIDDFVNLVDNQALMLREISPRTILDAALSSQASPFHRPLAMLSFAANYTLAGNRSSYPVKLTNIYIHILTGLGILLLTLELLRRLPESTLLPRDDKYIRLIALTCTCVWLFHPLFVSTVLYAVQRMAMLSTLFVIYGCVCYLRLRDTALRRAGGLLPLYLCTGIFTVLGFLCKENGALLPGFLLLIEWFCFRFAFHPDTPAFRIRFLKLMLIAPTLFILVYLAGFYAWHMHENIGNFYFSYQERLLTQLRVLWRYAGWLMFLNPEPMGIYHDDFPWSTGLMHPASTLLSLLAWLVLAALMVRYHRSRHALIFCALWFLWGHVLESTVLPLSLMFEHRNYLPGYGIILGDCLLIIGVLHNAQLRNTLKYGLITMVFFLLPLYTLYERVTPWGEEKSLILSLMTRQPQSPQTLIMAARYLNDAKDYRTSLRAIRYTQELDPREAAYVFAEAAVLCDNFPERAFDGRLRQKLQHLKISNRGTANTVTQFRLMVQVCRPSIANHGVLLDLYQRLQTSLNKKLSVYAAFGYGYIQLQRGNYSATIAAWERVIATDRYAAVLVGQLEQVKKLQTERREQLGSE